MTFNEVNAGKSGRGVVIQDVNASNAICMGRIRDLSMYSKMVPHVKKVDIYESVTFANVGSNNDGVVVTAIPMILCCKHKHALRYEKITVSLDYFVSALSFFIYSISFFT